jgi:hypothetical protein
MSDARPAERPLWLRDRDTVIAHDEGVVWRKVRPDYHLTNQIVHKERTRQLLQGSLELAVEDLVRVFEMEVSHKRDPAQWLTIVPVSKKVEIFGMTVARCAEDLRLLEVEHFYDNSLFLSQLCPIHKAAK